MNHRASRKLWVCLLGLVMASSAALAADPTTRPALEPADQPAVKVDKTGKPDKNFLAKHANFLKRGQAGEIGVLFLGDSITEGWGKAKDLYNQEYTKYHPANFGIGGDKTQHVLWRIANGELDGISPKVLVLMIGTNNSGYPAEDITKGDLEIVKEIHEKLPETRLLVLGIFPRGANGSDAGVKKLRDKLSQVNAELAKLDDGNKTRYLDFGDKFLEPNGDISKEIMNDGLHPTAKGYQIWADAMRPLLDEMMK